MSIAVVGCGQAERNEIEKLRRELEQTRAELVAQRNTARASSYLDELERLEALREKNVLSQVEFNARKEAVMKSLEHKPATAPAGSGNTMTDVAEQLRNVNSLYQKSTINNLDRDKAKKNLIAKPLVVTNMAKDLELVAALYQESVINNLERDELKKKLLDSDAPVK